ncbi:MAG: putative ABC transport system permease protein [Cryomorphaceae bacterium]|jgi:putative ABC transport system permease protein
MQTIPVANLALMMLPAAAVVVILWRWTSDAKTPSYALSRMIIQLCLIGYVLTYIFKTEQFALVLSVLSIMLLVSSWIALRSVPERRKELYFKALAATFVVNASLLALATKGVLRSDPWFAPAIVIPIAGMIFAVGMNAISLFAERYFSELERNVSDESARNTAYKATLIPTINSLFAVGLVSLPGMMTGQILSGISPLIAVRYQIMIMLLLFASSGLTAALFYVFARKDVQTSD